MFENLRIKNLNELNRGIHKRWIWKNAGNYNISCDYLQKINYCIQDLNREFESVQIINMKEVIYTIVLVDWIFEAIDSLERIIPSKLIENYKFSKEKERQKMKKYIKAMRSFVVAHPLNTTRHETFGLDGDMICVDIRSVKADSLLVSTNYKDCFYINMDGMYEYEKENINEKIDYILYVYSRKGNDMEFFRYVGANYSDLYLAAEMEIEYLYELDKYLGKLKKKEWII